MGESAAHLATWKARIEGFLAERVLLQLSPSGERLRPVSDGVDFLGYIVRQRVPIEYAGVVSTAG